MLGLRPLIDRQRPLVALFLACAMLARLAVPSGYMIGADLARGTPVIEICTGHGAATMAAGNLAGKPAKDDHQSSTTDHFCAFAGAGLALDLTPPLIALPQTAVLAAMPMAITGHAAPGRGLAAPPPPKTGPPAIV